MRWINRLEKLNEAGYTSRYRCDHRQRILYWINFQVNFRDSFTFAEGKEARNIQRGCIILQKRYFKSASRQTSNLPSIDSPIFILGRWIRQNGAYKYVKTFLAEIRKEAWSLSYIKHDPIPTQKDVFACNQDVESLEAKEKITKHSP